MPARAALHRGGPRRGCARCRSGGPSGRRRREAVPTFDTRNAERLAERRPAGGAGGRRDGRARSLRPVKRTRSCPPTNPRLPGGEQVRQLPTRNGHVRSLLVYEQLDSPREQAHRRLHLVRFVIAAEHCAGAVSNTQPDSKDGGRARLKTRAGKKNDVGVGGTTSHAQQPTAERVHTRVTKRKAPSSTCSERHAGRPSSCPLLFSFCRTHAPPPPYHPPTLRVSTVVSLCPPHTRQRA